MSSSEVPGLKRPALGRGFNSLLGLSELDPAAEAARAEPTIDGHTHADAIQKLRIADVEPNPQQPRKIFDDEALRALSQSIREDGVIQPIIVAKSQKPGKYTLIAGERRWRASQLAEQEFIPAIIKDLSSEASLRWALIENIQRADLSVIEEAEAYQSLITDFGLSQEQCAKKVGKDRSTVTNALRLLQLPREIQDDLLEKRLTMGHGRSLLSLEDKKLMLRARDMVVKKQLSVRQTEQFCKRFRKENERAGAEAGLASTTAESADIDYLADTLRSQLKTKVRIVGDQSKGRIEISYFSPAELDRLLGAMGMSVD